MTAAELGSNPMRWAAPRSSGECIQALDAARAWLTNRCGEVTAEQFAAATRSALAITCHLGRLDADVASSSIQVPSHDLFTELARSWRRAASAAAGLRSPTGAGASPVTLTVALDGIDRWLHAQVRHTQQLQASGQRRHDFERLATNAQRDGWRATVAEFVARMPDLADLLRLAALRAHERRTLLAPTGRLHRRPGQLVYVPEWGPAPAGRGPYHDLKTHLRTVSESSRKVATVIGVTCRPGLAEIDNNGRRSAARPARLARQSFPQRPDPIAGDSTASAAELAYQEPRPGHFRRTHR